MKRVLLTVAYDGTDFHGFAFQEGVRTVEGEIARAVEEVCGEKAEIIGASRTDAGVHAYGNLACFDTAASVPAERMAYALNSHLDADLRILSSEEVSSDFHPRKTGWPKTYEYRILNTRVPDPLLRRTATHVEMPLDTDAMQKASDMLTGTHDFTSFCSVHALSPTRVRTIRQIRVMRKKPETGSAAYSLYMPGTANVNGDDAEKDAPLVIIRVTGDGFLYHMVRIIAGTLIDVGRGKLQPDAIRAILDARDRARAGKTLEPQGLILLGYHRKEHPCTTDF